MPHANARLTFHGCCELVRRVRMVGRPYSEVSFMASRRAVTNVLAV